MAALKRKAGLSEKLGRRVRARVADSVPEEMDSSDGAPSEEGFQSDQSVTGDEGSSDEESGSEAVRTRNYQFFFPNWSLHR